MTGLPNPGESRSSGAWGLASAAVGGIAAGVTLYLWSYHPPADRFGAVWPWQADTGLERRGRFRWTLTDMVAMVCAMVQPRVFLGLWVWHTLWPTHRPPPRSTSPATPESPTSGSGTLRSRDNPPTAYQRDVHKRRKKRYLELLVHNVSHSDLILGLEPATVTPTRERTSSSEPDQEAESSFILCRPRFSRFHKCSVKLAQNLSPSTLLRLPCYQRQFDSPRYSIVLRKDTHGATEYHQQSPTPTGLCLQRPVALDLDDVRVRTPDTARLPAHTPLQIRHVFLPLLATLLPRWSQQIDMTHGNHRDQRHAATVHRVLVLVSGVGTPRDTTQKVTDNSTEVCAELMKDFVHRVDPDVTVIHIHSHWNIFRYDENVRFVKEVFMPRIHAYRDAHARGLPYPHELSDQEALLDNDAIPFQEDWRDSFTTTLSWADGSNARTYAIQCGLRDYRPFYYHFWQLKTFWHECKIVIDDIEVHSYAAMELIPPVDTNRLPNDGGDNTDIVRVVEEIKAFRRDVLEVFQQGKHELSRFWLRKTRKPVLAVLLVRSPNSPPMIFRGTNMEVSMPTGSLCAERNVIGTALASNPAIRRQDLKVLAVLAVPFDEPDARQQPAMSRITSFAAMDQPSRKSSIGSEGETAEWQEMNSMPWHPDPGEMESSFMMVHGAAAMPSGDDDEPPAKRIDLFSGATTQSTMRTVVLKQSTKQRDLNPLAPCGACNEWLKKIAESNPYFKILTFTDCQCHGVYITPCKDS